MNATEYWPLAREYAIWNATVTTLQFWTAHLEPHTLSSTIDWVYNSFIYTSSALKILLGCFMTTLNHTFERTFNLEDEGYQSGNEDFNIPTPLRWTSRVHHVSSNENISLQSFHSMHHSYIPVDPQTHTTPLIIQQYWWGECPSSLQHHAFSTSSIPHSLCIAITCEKQPHLWWHHGWRRRFPNCHPWWWPLDHRPHSQ